MLLFHNDYNQGCHGAVLAAMTALEYSQNEGYGMDVHCQKAADLIRRLCGRQDLAVHFLVGGTQANLTVLAAGLRPHQGVIGAQSAHIHVHETGAVEATGHKVLALPSEDGKIRACHIAELVDGHYASADAEHMAQPKMVYLSHPTELGTLYSLEELEEIHRVCRQRGLYLFVDGARLGYGLTAPDTDVTLEDLARLCDVFYMGGTKCGALFGEAVVIGNREIARDFRYLIKQRGGMLAKGWLLGVQFEALLQDGLYFDISRHANAMARQLRSCLDSIGCGWLAEPQTNQLFPILEDSVLEKLAGEFTFSEMHRVDETHRAVRFCTSWATTAEQVEALCCRLSEVR